MSQASWDRSPNASPIAGGLLIQPGLSSADHSLRSISHLELAEDVRDVVAHRLQTQAQAVSNLRVGAPLSDQDQDLALAVGEVREGLGQSRRPRGGKVLHQTPR